ncbi:uncharacterized protein NEMAJ01_1955 [Nematocida major]|uniref:uncharacterized protein n=1 Tax=Nematocida major TaxID=1912982 RepID=UPI002007E6CB|nr:uncharacterized protein NEMAJ01_1955 [Nematocida major]KAH9387059.1 hypothetical protein NEMAJ01_1955 [Nematocida major]
MRIQSFFCGLALPFAYARLSLLQIEKTQSATVLAENCALLKINPEGPLNLMRGYLYQRMGLVQNKRMFSPEIDTAYSLRHSSLGEQAKEPYVYSRSAVADRARLLGAEGGGPEAARENEQYFMEYHRMLILMFPSASGELSIEAGRPNAFTRFLRAPAVEKHAHQVLAALLLLSEGIDVPVCISGKNLVLKKKGGKAIFCLSMLTPAQSSKPGKALLVWQKEAAEVIMFFLKHKNVVKTPHTMESFLSGEFLDSAQFLIQAYIFEFLDSVESAKKLFASVYEILGAAVGFPEAHAEKAESALFVPAQQCFEAMQLSPWLKRVQIVVEKYGCFPFASSCHLPGYVQIPPCIRVQSHENAACELYEDTTKTFSNCVEVGLYALFCCLTYNPDPHEYTLAKLPGATDGLKAFFTKHAAPVECVSLELHRAWNQVVSNLSCGRVAYKRQDRNELRTGLLNILLALAEITGRLGAEEETIAAFMEEVSGPGEPSKAFYARVGAYAANFLLSLSASEEMDIWLRDGRRGVRSDGKHDVYGDIVLKTTQNGNAQGIVFELKEGHTSIKMLAKSASISFEGVQELEHIKDKCARTPGFTRCLLAHYIAQCLDMARSQEELCINGIKRAAQNMATNSFSSIREVMLLRKIQHVDQKRAVVELLLMQATAEGIELAKGHPILCFVSNIIGSTPLADTRTQYSILRIPACTGVLKKHLPRISLQRQRYIEIFKTSRSLQDMEYLEKSKYALFTIETLRAYPRETDEVLSCSKDLNIGYRVENLFNVLFACNSMVYARKLAQLLQEENSAQASLLKHTLDLVWFGLACVRKKEYADLIKELYDELSPNCMYDRAHDAIKYFSKPEEVCAVVEGMKKSMHLDQSSDKLRMVFSVFKPPCNVRFVWGID